MTIVYGIPNCDTVKKARKWLDEKGAAYSFHDFRKDGLDTALIAEMEAAIGAEKLINRRGTTWRKLDAAEQAAIEQDLSRLVDYPAMIKRPVFRLADGWVIGFGKAEQAELESKLS